jgi:hypothetical protein
MKKFANDLDPLDAADKPRHVEAAGEMLTDPNKNARIVWAMMASGECYRQDETYAA